MPTDKHGQTHSGTIGLFDDDDEHIASVERAERHERQALESKIRRYTHRAKRQNRKDKRTADGKYVLPSWLGHFVGKSKGKEAGGGGGGQEKVPIPQAEEEYIVVRKPSAPETIYTAEDIDPIDSLWLRECGMVRVRSDDAGGCHIVPKSSVQKND